VTSGHVSGIKSKDSSIATGSTTAIRGNKGGETTITYQDAEDPDHAVTVHVTVLDEGKENWGFYKVVPVYEEYISYNNGGEGSYVKYYPSLGPNEIPYVLCTFGGWSIHMTRRGIHQGSDVGTALLDPKLSSDREYAYIDPTRTLGAPMYGYNQNTETYSDEYWAETTGWTYTNEQPLPYSFTVTQHTVAYLNGAFGPIAEVTRITRYELTAFRSWVAVAEDLSNSGWTTD
jgi:hypothetical protein